MNIKKRIHMLDEIRGFAIICMVIFHALYTITHVYTSSVAMDNLFEFLKIFEPMFAAVFIIMAGISSQLSRNNFKRSFLLLLVANVISLVMLLILPENKISFGILHFLGISILIFYIFKRFIEKQIKTSTGIALCSLLFFVTYNVPYGYILFENFKLPKALYSSNYAYAFGFPNSLFYSSDYFPLLPWFFMFMIGILLGRYAKAQAFPQTMYKNRAPFLSQIGRQSLVIYILHQPIIFGIIYLINI